MRSPASAVLILALAASAAPAVASVEECLRAAAEYQRVPHDWLVAIAKTESNFNAAAVNKKNRNGSTDHGLMQVNSDWLGELERYGITEKDLYDPCINAHVGAWILAQNIKRFGLTNEAIGAYNAGPRGKDATKLNYVEKVVRSWNKLQQRGASAR